MGRASGVTMSSDTDLRAKKLQAEIRNLEKECQKLDEEIANLRRARRSRLKDVTWWRDLFGIVSVLVMLFLSGWGFLSELKERGRFQITAEVIRLVEKLRADDPAEREHAAILLAAYGEHALPILLNDLQIAERAESGAAKALVTIARTGQKGSKLVTLALRERARTSFQAVLGRDEERVQALINCLLVLGEIGGLDRKSDTAALFQEIQEGLDCSYLLYHTDAPLDPASASLSEDTKTDRINICLRLKQAVSKLEAGG